MLQKYDDYICNIKVVNDIEEAIEHIYNYSTKHSESIITENRKNSKIFHGVFRFGLCLS